MADMEMNVPDGWEKLNVGQILETTRNGFSGTQVDYITPFPVSRIETISDGKVNYEKVGFVKHIPSRYELVKGDILFSNINSIKHIGKLAYVEEGSALYHGMNLLLFRFAESVDTRFIYYYLLTRKKWFEQVATQAINQASINQTTLKGLEVIIPKSLTEQRQIARILSKVDEAISQTEQLIAKYRRLKTGLMQDLLTKGIDAHGNIRSEETHAFKDSPLGRIPVEWEVNSLQAVCAYDITYGIVQAGRDFTNGVPYIRTGDMSGDKLSIDGLLRTNPVIAARFSRSRVQTGEIVFALRATIGKVLIVPQELDGANLTQGTARISAKENIISNALLLWCLRMPSFKNQILQNQKGTTFFEISLTQLRKMQVAFPKSLEEQESITTILVTAERKIESSELRLSKLHAQKTGLMQDLLSGKVRVGQLIRETAAV